MTTDERELWKQKDAGDLDARNELVVRYEKTALSLVWSRYNGNIIHRNDWESEILYFLIAAVDGYSLGRGTKFTTFLRACLQLAVTTAYNLGLNVVRPEGPGPGSGAGTVTRTWENRRQSVQMVQFG